MTIGRKGYKRMFEEVLGHASCGDAYLPEHVLVRSMFSPLTRGIRSGGELLLTELLEERKVIHPIFVV
jgi:hypothetical protein